VFHQVNRVDQREEQLDVPIQIMVGERGLGQAGRSVARRHAGLMRRLISDHLSGSSPARLLLVAILDDRPGCAAECVSDPFMDYRPFV
jgi:hypothetical protein